MAGVEICQPGDINGVNAAPEVCKYLISLINRCVSESQYCDGYR